MSIVRGSSSQFPLFISYGALSFGSHSHFVVEHPVKNTKISVKTKQLNILFSNFIVYLILIHF